MINRNSRIFAVLLVGHFAVTACDDTEVGHEPTSGPPGAMVEVDPDGIALGASGGTANSTGTSPVSTGGTSTPTEPLKGSLGTPCDVNSDCQAPLFCNVDDVDYIGHKQCTITCSGSETCTTSFGNDSFCVGAGFCVRSCTEDSDCPSLTRCGGGAWCDRGGPGSGVPTCTGYATSCALLGGTSCLTAFGCKDASRCSGISSSCYSKYSSYTCSSQEGCYWSAVTSNCSGSSSSCSTMLSSLSCTYQDGCSWLSNCTGVPDACDTFPPSLCENQPGCYLLTE